MKAYKVFESDWRCRGFLKEIGYKTAFKRAWANASTKEREQCKSLPNFDADIFLEISGVDVREGS
jgi:hypothetical protein